MKLAKHQYLYRDVHERKPCTHAGIPASGFTTSWNDLPDHLVEVILAHLSLVDLWATLKTCRSFHTAFCRQLDVEQKSRCDFAAMRFGTKPIACLRTLITRYLKGERLEPGVVNENWNCYCISADGVLRRTEPHRWACRYATQPGEICVSALVHQPGYAITNPYTLWVRAHAWEQPLLLVATSLDRSCSTICVKPRCDEDLEGVALVQALLSGGLAESIHDGGQSAEIRVGRPAARFGFTRKGLKA